MTPRFCPACGKEGLTKTTGDGHIERGCWDGKSYCWDDVPPAYVCTDSECGYTFTVEPSEDEIHDDCSCENNRLCDCGRYHHTNDDHEQLVRNG